MKNTNDIKVNNPIIMNQNLLVTNNKGYQIAIFNVENNALHVTVRNVKSVTAGLAQPLTFSVLLKEMQEFYEKKFFVPAKTIILKENRKHQDPTENQLIIILK